MKPFIKWAGGKAQLAPTLVEFFPQKIEKYVEPFLGGGAMFFHLSSSGHLDFAKRIILSDTNNELINAWKVIRSGTDKLIELLDIAEEAHMANPESYYYIIRGLNPHNLSPHYMAARFIYLNKAGFNGLYRVNKSGKFNVPFGKKKEVKTYEGHNLKSIHNELNKEIISISNADYEFVCDIILASGCPQDYFIYFDPPYVPLNDTSDFTGYTAGGFNFEDQVKLAQKCQELDEAGVKWALSNSDTLLVKKLYAQYNCHTVMATRRINSKGNKRGPISELLITNYDVNK